MIVLVLGGTRSGKSEVAERLATSFGGPVTAIFPAVVTDADFGTRVAEHRARRPSSWTTVECGDQLVAAVAGAHGTVLIDSLGTWVSETAAFEVDREALVTALRARAEPTVVVSDEVGLAVHPATELGRRFVDALGELNRAVAAIADDAVLVIAGRTLRLEAE